MSLGKWWCLRIGRVFRSKFRLVLVFFVGIVRRSRVMGIRVCAGSLCDFGRA